MASSVAVEAGLILVREGLEALLVIAALAAYLTKIGHRHRFGSLVRGAAAAVAASLAAAWAFQRFLGGAHNDLVEAITVLVAAALLFYVSGWLFLRRDPRVWEASLRGHVERALDPAAGLPLAAVAFVAVFREGAEAVLFLNALAVTHGGWGLEIAAGLAGATGALLALGYAISRIAGRLPMRPLFAATSAFLFFMGLKFVGAALLEFQEMGRIPFQYIGGGEIFRALGFNPSREAVAAQLAICTVAAVSAVVLRRRAARADASA